MDSTHKPKSFYTYLFFVFILFSTNLFTLFLSSTCYSSCSFQPFFATTTAAESSSDDVSKITLNLPPEFNTFTSGQKLPLGYKADIGSDTIYPPVGGPCTHFPDELRRYMSYKVNGSCPDDELLAQKLLLKAASRYQAGDAVRLLHPITWSPSHFQPAYGLYLLIHLWYGRLTNARTMIASSTGSETRRVSTTA